MTNQLKNPFFWYVVLFAGGMLIAALGWIKNESTIATHTTGAVPMIIIGCGSIVVGAIGMFSANKRK